MVKEYSETIRLRQAIANDKEIIFKWRNDKFIVNRSSSQRCVKWKEHSDWFENALSNPKIEIYIIMKINKNIGQVRFDLVDSKLCVISIYLLKEYSGKGYGILALKESIDKILKNWEIQKIIAYVRKENAIGLKVFEKAGFAQIENTITCPNNHYTLSLKVYRISRQK